jgi:hypothetical protein
MRFIEPPEWIPLLPRPGVFKHPSYGEIKVDRARNERFIANIKAKVYQPRLPIDAEHQTKVSGAMGWIIDARLNSDGSADGKVEWNDRGKAMLKDNRFAYVSPEWYDRWSEPETGEEYQDVLIGAALTSRPFFKSPALRPLIASEHGFLDSDDTDTNPAQGVTPMAEPNTPTIHASEQDAARAQQFAEMQATLAALQSENAGLKTASEQTATALKQAAERIQAMETDARRKRFTTLATGDKQSPRWFGEVVKHVSLLETLADTFDGEDSEQFKGYVQQQRAMAELLRESALFREVGTDASGRPPSAWSKIEQQAKTLREQDRTLTHEQAISRVIASEPQLYNEYRAEQAA